jgi:hypothetical protein
VHGVAFAGGEAGHVKPMTPPLPELPAVAPVPPRPAAPDTLVPPPQPAHSMGIMTTAVTTVASALEIRRRSSVMRYLSRLRFEDLLSLLPTLT